MKLGKLSIIFLSLGIFAISFASIGTIHSQQLTEKEKLEKELAQAQLRLSKVQLTELTDKRAELEKTLADTRQEIQNTKKALAKSVGTLDFTNLILNTAANTKVVITDMKSSGTAAASLEGLPSTALTASVSIEGEIDNIIRFVAESRNAAPNILVKSADIRYPQKEGDKPRATVQLTAYSYKGG